MMRRSIALVLSVCAGACASAGRPAPPAPALADSLAPIAFFAGTWDGQMRTAEGEALTMVWRVSPSLGGRWLAGEARAEPAGIEARDYWGIDAATGEVVRIYVDGNGTFGELRSSGWRGDAWTFEGEMSAAGSRVRVRELIERTGPDEFRAEWQAWVDGAWVTSSAETLRRR